jgi:tetratricopeptide (TPR) repeat protein
MNPTYVWIDCASWELDFFHLPHRIPWPSAVPLEVSKKEPFELEHLLQAIDSMGADACEPWTGFRKAAQLFEELSEALEDSEIRRAAELLDRVEALHSGSAFRLFHQAHLARNEGDLNRACALYREASEKSPGISEIWNNLGLTLALNQRREEAVAAYRQALQVSPQNRNALEGLAQTRELIKLMRDPKDPNSAVYMEIAEFRRMAQNQVSGMASDHEQLLNYGEELCRSGVASDVGVEAMEKARALNPDDPRTLFSLAKAYHGLGNFQEARTVTQRLAELFPDRAEPFFHLAQMCNALDDSAGERAALERCVANDPNCQPALGIFFQLQPGEHDPAKEQQLIEFAEKRNSWLAFVLASTLCGERGDFNRAQKWAERAVETAPDCEEALLHLVASIGKSKALTKLASDIKPKVDSGKFSKRLDWNYAHVLKELGLHNDATAALRKVASSDVPDDVKSACSTTLEAWAGVLAAGGVPLETLPSGILLRDVLVSLADEDGGIVLKAGEKLPAQGVFPWRATAAETSVSLQQGQTGSGRPIQPLGEFKIRGIETTQGSAQIECLVVGLPDGSIHFRAAQENRRLVVLWQPPRGTTA